MKQILLGAAAVAIALSFGAVHNADENLKWFGPGAWRQTGVNWSYEYQLRRMGILAAPIVKARG